MYVRLSKMQIIHLENICKKGWGGYSEPSDDLEEMVKKRFIDKVDRYRISPYLERTKVL